MPWTTPIRCGAAQLEASFDYPVNNITNLLNLNGIATAQTADTGDVTSHYYSLTNWNTTIPGGGAAVSQIDLSFEASKVEGGPSTSWHFDFGYNQTAELISVGIPTGSWQSFSVIEAPSYFGLNGTEIDNIISNSATYGFGLYNTNVSPGAPMYFSIRNITLSFLYSEGSGIILV